MGCLSMVGRSQRQDHHTVSRVLLLLFKSQSGQVTLNLQKKSTPILHSDAESGLRRKHLKGSVEAEGSYYLVETVELINSKFCFKTKLWLLLFGFAVLMHP